MTRSFAKAPLVEIVAELRWVPAQLSRIPEGQPQIPIPLMDSKLEDFFMRAGQEFSKLGFNIPERLVQPGFVLLLNQPVVRFSKGPGRSPILYQVGPGIFSTHGLPPYKSWEYFSPEVERGVDSLLRARDPRERAFLKASLRYIDAFSQELRGDKSELEFIRDVLGISIILPANIVDLVEPGSTPQLGMQVVMPVTGGMTMNINLQEGSVNNMQAIIMDTTVSQEGEIAPGIREIMSVFHDAHRVIHKAFFEMTKPIHDLMQPQEV